MRYGSLSAQGWLSFSEIAMWGDKPWRLRLSMKAIADGQYGRESRFTDMQNMNPETLARTSEAPPGDNRKSTLSATGHAFRLRALLGREFLP